VLYSTDSSTTFGTGRQIKTGPARAKQIQENLPGSELLIIASAAHFSNVEQPEVFNKAMLAFLDKHAA